MSPAARRALYRRLFRDQLERFYEERSHVYIRANGPEVTHRIARRFARRHAQRIMQYWTA